MNSSCGDSQISEIVAVLVEIDLKSANSLRCCTVFSPNGR